MHSVEHCGDVSIFDSPDAEGGSTVSIFNSPDTVSIFNSPDDAEGVSTHQPGSSVPSDFLRNA